MSIRFINYVWEESPYEGRKLLLHLALADFANDEGVCFPSLKTLAKKARCTDTWCSLSIKQMVVEGWLEIVDQGGGRGRASTYRLIRKTLSELKECDHKPLILNSNTFNSEDTLTIYKNHIEPDIDQHQFDAFWSAYPRKVAKRAAMKAFAKVMQSKDAPTIKQLLDGVNRYKSSTLDSKFIAHPATWLNQGRWEDDLPETTSQHVTEQDYEKQNVIKAVVAMRHANFELEQVQNFLANQRDDLQEMGLTIFREGITT